MVRPVLFLHMSNLCNDESFWLTREFEIIKGNYLKNFKNKQLWERGVLVETRDTNYYKYC